MALLPPISTREIAEGLYGATRLARGDASGIQFFGDTPEAFWKSFWAAVLSAPAYALLVLFQLADAEIRSGPLRVILIESVGYVVAWVAFPLAMHYLAEFIDRREHYIRFIAAANWASVLQFALQLFVAAFLALDILPPGLARFLQYATYGAIILYEWWIARVGLQLGRGGAVGIVILDFVISLVLSGIVGAML